MVSRWVVLLLMMLPFSALSASLKVASGQPAPVLVVELSSGRVLDIASLRGNVVLVNFWATWCPPCRKEMPSMDRLEKMTSGQPFTILAINVKEEPDQVQRFLEEMPVGFPMGLDTDGSTAKAWKAFMYPTSFLVDKTGRIRYSLNGTLEWDEPEVVEIIEHLMAEK